MTSDYQIAKKIGISPQRVSKYRNGHDYFGEEVAVTAAELLEIEPGQILADIAAERTKCPAAKEAWQRVARTMSGAFASVIVVVFVVLATMPAPALAAVNADPCYILCKIEFHPQKQQKLHFLPIQLKTLISCLKNKLSFFSCSPVFCR